MVMVKQHVGKTGLAQRIDLPTPADQSLKVGPKFSVVAFIHPARIERVEWAWMPFHEIYRKMSPSARFAVVRDKDGRLLVFDVYQAKITTDTPYIMTAVYKEFEDYDQAVTAAAFSFDKGFVVDGEITMTLNTKEWEKVRMREITSDFRRKYPNVVKQWGELDARFVKQVKKGK